MTDAQLIARFVKTGDEAAFTKLVGRYKGFLYSVCLRELNGDAHAAQEVTQAAFIVLARKAAGIRKGALLGSWLFKVAVNAARTYIKAESRRRRVEMEAGNMKAEQTKDEKYWELLKPHLNKAIESLRPKTREAVILHYLQQKDQRSVAAALNCTTAAAAKRIEYGKKKIHAFLKRKGIAFPMALFTAILAHGSLEAAPAGFTAACASSAVSLASASLAGSGASALLAQGVIKMMFIEKLKLALGSLIAVVLVSAGTAGGIMAAAEEPQQEKTEHPQIAQAVENTKPAVKEEKKTVKKADKKPATSVIKDTNWKLTIEERPLTTMEERKKHFSNLFAIKSSMKQYNTLRKNKWPRKLSDLSPKFIPWHWWKDANGNPITDRDRIDELFPYTMARITTSFRNEGGKMVPMPNGHRIAVFRKPADGDKWILGLKLGENFPKYYTRQKHRDSDYALCWTNISNKELTLKTPTSHYAEIRVISKDGTAIPKIQQTGPSFMMGGSEKLKPGKYFMDYLDLWALFKKPEGNHQLDVKVKAFLNNAAKESDSGQRMLEVSTQPEKPLPPEAIAGAGIGLFGGDEDNWITVSEKRTYIEAEPKTIEIPVKNMSSGPRTGRIISGKKYSPEQLTELRKKMEAEQAKKFILGVMEVNTQVGGFAKMMTRGISSEIKAALLHSGKFRLVEMDPKMREMAKKMGKGKIIEPEYKIYAIITELEGDRPQEIKSITISLEAVPEDANRKKATVTGRAQNMSMTAAIKAAVELAVADLITELGEKK